ncbi:MAG: hypothetical protein J6Y45_04975 [Bacteroidales bacterium]|nr:hypothetical protein [Bacteroidales bacterium]
MKAKSLFIAAAACLIALLSCSPSGSDENGSDSGKKAYATITVNGETWPEAEISFYKATISEDQVPFRLILDAEKTRANTGYLFYNPEDEDDRIQIQIMYRESEKEGYHASLKEGKGEIKAKGDSQYEIDIDGTDDNGNKLVVKGVANGS